MLLLNSLTGALLLHERATAVGPFTWSWSVHPSVVIGTGVFGAVYFWGIGTWRRRRELPPARPWQPACMLLALGLLLVSLNGPVHDLSDDYLFWVHMLQHMALTLVFPPLLLAAIPAWLLSPVLAVPAVRRVARVLTHPVTAGVLFSLIFSVWHTAYFYETMMEVHAFHIASHLIVMAAAVLLWWPVLSPSPELPKLSPGKAVLYLFLVSLPMQLVAAILTFADAPLYHWYVDAPRVPEFGSLSALEDLKFGGLLMWIPGNLYMFGAMAAQFRRWVREDAQSDERERAAGRAAGFGTAAVV